MPARDERLEENQRAFREANERLQALAASAGVRDGTVVPFLCECADEECLGRVEITIGEYEATHWHYDYYVILRGHPRVAGEDIIEENDRYEVVQKNP
jgi:hypothetical protein